MSKQAEQVISQGLAGRFQKWNHITQTFDLVRVPPDFVPPYAARIPDLQSLRRHATVGGKLATANRFDRNPKSRPWSADVLSQAKRAREDGATWAEIGKAFGVSEDCARRRCS